MQVWSMLTKWGWLCHFGDDDDWRDENNSADTIYTYISAFCETALYIAAAIADMQVDDVNDVNDDMNDNEDNFCD